VRIRRRAQEIEEGLKHRSACPRCAAISVRRSSTGVWECRRCGYVFAGGAYRPIVTTSFKREIEETKDKGETKPEAA
jgi:ribosomal protein L37AE/L43A